MNEEARRTVSVEEAVAYGFLAALGGYFCYVAFGYGLFVEEGRVGPGLLPAVVGGLLSLVSVVKLAEALRGRPTPHDRGLAAVAASLSPELVEEHHTDVDIFGRTPKQRMRQLRLVFAALIVTLLLVPVVGFLVAFFALSLFISAVVERRPWIPSAVISLVSVAIVYGVFVVFLSVPLPEGLLALGG